MRCDRNDPLKMAVFNSDARANKTKIRRAGHTTGRHFRRWFRAAAAGLLAAAMMAGCSTLPSQKTSFPVTSSSAPGANAGTSGAGTGTDDKTFDAGKLLEQAIKTTDTAEQAQRFWFSGFIRNTMQNDVVTSMFQGVVSRPKEAFIVNGRIAAQPFQYYGYDGLRYIKASGGWQSLADDEEAPLPLDPMFGFRDWLPLMSDAVRRPDEAVLGVPSTVIEVRLDGKSWVERSPSSLFDPLREQLGASLELDQLLSNTVVKATFWIDKEHSLISQYQTWIVLPLPGGGYVDQETFVRLFRFGDPSIDTQHLPSLEVIEDWVRKYEELLKENREFPIDGVLEE